MAKLYYHPKLDLIMEVLFAGNLFRYYTSQKGLPILSEYPPSKFKFYYIGKI